LKIPFEIAPPVLVVIILASVLVQQFPEGSKTPS
jgi:hypothetical protein